MIRVLMVCLGNICRSPMAEAVFRAEVEAAGLGEHFEIASAGTGTWHVGQRPHEGTLGELERRGLGLPGKRAQNIRDFELEDWDYVVAMDADNQADLPVDAPLLLEFANEPLDRREVPDPYYYGGFDRVYELVEAGSRGLLAHIVEAHGLAPEEGDG